MTSMYGAVCTTQRYSRQLYGTFLHLYWNFRCLFLVCPKVLKVSWDRPLCLCLPVLFLILFAKKNTFHLDNLNFSRSSLLFVFEKKLPQNIVFL